MLGEIKLVVRGCTEPEEFTVYPPKDGVAIIQSDSRIGYLYRSGFVRVTRKYRGGAFQPHLAFANIEWWLKGEQLAHVERIIP